MEAVFWFGLYIRSLPRLVPTLPRWMCYELATNICIMNHDTSGTHQKVKRGVK